MNGECISDRKERKGASYVWNYCEKLTRYKIRCKLCMKIMSFHGTANIITHLHRRHNVLGDNVVQTSISEMPADVLNNFENPENLYLYSPRKKSKSLPTTSSVVWKYCTRISPVQARCCLCEKNLSYQGTSNLQRHLHRMHGVSTHGQSMLKLMGEPATVINEDVTFSADMDQLMQFCTQIDSGNKIKCNMCRIVYDKEDTEAVIKHMVLVHCVQLNPNLNSEIAKLNTKNCKSKIDIETSDEGNFDEDYTDSQFSRIDDSSEPTAEFDENNIKRDDSFYAELIEEDFVSHDGKLFTPSLLQESQQCSVPSNSSRGKSPEMFVSLANQQMQISNAHLLKLQEDRLRSETEYFREKAGYYRMLKHLTAFQARKTRMELQCSKPNAPNIGNTNDLKSSFALHTNESVE